MESGGKIVPNTDNEGLGPLIGKGFAIGLVDEISGEGGEEIPDFAVTRYELLELARFWAREQVEIQWLTFTTGQTGSSEWRTVAYADRRIDHIAEIIGVEPVERAVEGARAEFGREQDRMSWWVFCHGSKEDRKAFDEITGSMFDWQAGVGRKQVQAEGRDLEQMEESGEQESADEEDFPFPL